MITWDAYYQMVINGFFFGIGVMAAFAAGAFILAIMVLIILKVFTNKGNKKA